MVIHRHEDTGRQTIYSNLYFNIEVGLRWLCELFGNEIKRVKNWPNKGSLQTYGSKN